MRSYLLALALLATAGAAHAQQDPSDPGIRFTNPTAPAPESVRHQAEDAIRDRTANPGARFRSEGHKVAMSVKHFALDPPVDGPVSIVCGEYALRFPNGDFSGYAWFFTAIKHGQLLWADIDDANSGGPRTAYDACRGAELAN